MFAHAACDSYLKKLRQRRLREHGVSTAKIESMPDDDLVSEVLNAQGGTAPRVGRFNDWLDAKLVLIETDSVVMFSGDGSPAGHETSIVLTAVRNIALRARNDLLFPRSDDFRTYQRHIREHSANRQASLYPQKDLHTTWDAFIKDEQAVLKHRNKGSKDGQTAKDQATTVIPRAGSLSSLPAVGSPTPSKVSFSEDKRNTKSRPFQ
jgi:hypothetical protein